MDPRMEALKNNLRLTLKEYSDRINELEDMRKKAEYGGVEKEDILRVCDLALKAMLNAQIVALDRIHTRLEVLPADCPSCGRMVWVLRLGEGIAWVCKSCGTSSNRNYREPAIRGSEIPKENAADIIEEVLLGLQRKRK